MPRTHGHCKFCDEWLVEIVLTVLFPPKNILLDITFNFLCEPWFYRTQAIHSTVVTALRQSSIRLVPIRSRIRCRPKIQRQSWRPLYCRHPPHPPQWLPWALHQNPSLWVEFMRFFFNSLLYFFFSNFNAFFINFKSFTVRWIHDFFKAFFSSFNAFFLLTLNPSVRVELIN